MLKKLFSDSVIYAVANLLQRGMMLILLPIYARYFSKAEFGAMDLLYQGVLILIILSALGMPQGLPRGFHKKEVTEQDKRRLLGVLTLFLLPISLLVSGLIWLFSDAIAHILFNDQGERIWVELSAGLFMAMVIQQYPLMILKAQQRSLEYSLWSLGTFIIATLANLYLIVVLEMGLIGMLIANTLGFGLIGMVAMFRCLRQMEFNIEWSRLRPLLEFGLPMMPALIGRKILEASDRYMLPHYHSMDRLGEYVMGAKVANIVEILVLIPFLFAWQPFFYSVSQRSDAKSIYAKVTLYFFAILLMVLMGIYIVHGSVLDLIGNGEYNASSTIVMILVLAALINGMQYTISPGIHLSSKLVQEALLMILAAFLNLALNFWLIPPYGGEGAAVATLLAYLFYFCASFILAQCYYPIRYPYKRMLILLLVAVCFMGFIYVVTLIWVQLLLLLFFIVCGPLLDLYRHDRNVLNRLLSRVGGGKFCVK